MEIKNKIILEENNKEIIINFENLNKDEHIKWAKNILLKIIEKNGYKLMK